MQNRNSKINSYPILIVTNIVSTQFIKFCNLLNVRDGTRDESGADLIHITARLEYLAMLGSTHSCSTSETVRGPTTGLYYFMTRNQDI